MKLNDFYNQVSRKVDTGKTAISVAETKRVLSEAFLLLAKMKGPELMDTVNNGVKTAAKKLAK